MIGQQEWTIVSEDGSQAVEFDGFIDIDVKNASNVLTSPIEKSSFAAYNKIETPLDIYVTLASQKDAAAQTSVLSKLDKLVAGAVKVSVVTPTAVYKNMTVETYSYKRESGNGATLLVCELHLLEVREVETAKATKTKRPTSARKRNTGQTQTKPKVEESALFSLHGGKFNLR